MNRCVTGSLSVTTDEATWVLTSYLVSNATILPITGWLANHFGRKRLLMICVGLFTGAAILCGLAPSLGFLVASRVLQGAGGGATLPISQAVLLESFPPAERGVAMAVFAMGVVVAPILGPTLGGWITDNYSWRWIFYINLPVGVAAVLMAHPIVEDPPYIRRRQGARVDFIGFALLAVWLATLQMILDKGQQADWFDAQWVRWFTTISSLAFLGFVYCPPPQAGAARTRPSRRDPLRLNPPATDGRPGHGRSAAPGRDTRQQRRAQDGAALPSSSGPPSVLKRRRCYQRTVSQ